MRVKDGQTLFHQGDPSGLLYEVTRGVARLERVLPTGRRQVMSFGYAGDIVGFPQDGLHRSTCKMITPGTVVSHHVAAVDGPLADPDLRQRLFDAALTEIGVLHDHFQILGCCSAMERTAGFLVRLMDRVGVAKANQTVVHLPMCRSDIADYLGLSTETVSRMISQLRALQVIRLTDPQTVIVQDAERLSQLAEGE
jgi:CRP-like cAMP-binding protein